MEASPQVKWGPDKSEVAPLKLPSVPRVKPLGAQSRKASSEVLGDSHPWGWDGPGQVRMGWGRNQGLESLLTPAAPLDKVIFLHHSTCLFPRQFLERSHCPPHLPASPPGTPITPGLA